MSSIQTGGSHSLTAALTNLLANQGVKAPHTGAPYSEALVLGIGGGLGAGYILWEFKAHDSAKIVMGFRNRWNYPVEYLTNLATRINAKLTLQETGSMKAAAANLWEALARDVPCMLWIDKAHLPHQYLPEAQKGYNSQVVGAYGWDAGEQALLVDDLGDSLFSVPKSVLTDGRKRIGSDKNRTILVNAPVNPDLQAAVLAGIQDCVEHLGRDSESFSLPVYDKWAKLMTNPKNPKSWAVVFKERIGLYETLRSVYEGIILNDTEGCGLRGLYAQFLDEAATILANPALQTAATAYREAAEIWGALADAALPEKVEVFAQTRALLHRRYALLKAGQSAELAAVTAQLDTLQDALKRDFPLNTANTNALFEAMQAQLNSLYWREKAALELLREAVA
ncbi:MAG: DUF4872 domain-containing protein [Armatimonadetes bacterium]|nr:DUF4872 domain-containing protein [Anaerolineae bacterium]